MSNKLTKNFTVEELSCKCGCGGVITDEVFLHNLQQLRTMFGKPMVVSSGYRCPDYNLETSLTGRTGPHTVAAVDIKVYGKLAYELLWMASAQGFTGIGIKQKGNYNSRFIHLDRLELETRPWVWSY